MKKILLLLLGFSGLTLTAQTIISVGYNPPATLVADAGNDTTICSGCSVTLNGASSGGTASFNYSWSPVTGLSNPSIANPVATPSVTTTYTLTVTDVNNCSSTSDITVAVGVVGIEENILNKLVLAPNPADESVLLDFKKPLTEEINYQLIAPDGKIVKRGSLLKTNTEHRLNVLSLNSGVYILKIKDSKSMISRQVIVKH